MIRAIPARILCEVLLVIVGAEGAFRAEIRHLLGCGTVISRLSVDVDVDPPVVQVGVHVSSFRLDFVATRPKREKHVFVGRA